MTRLTRLSAAAQAHYVVLRSVPEISLIPFDRNIEKLFQIFSDGSRAYSTDISAFAVFTDQIHLLLTPREKAEDLSRFVQQLSRLYSHYFNDEFSRNGKIWQGRFESSLLQEKAGFWRRQFIWNGCRSFTVTESRSFIRGAATSITPASAAITSWCLPSSIGHWAIRRLSGKKITRIFLNAVLIKFSGKG